jgi:hypothetical protein
MLGAKGRGFSGLNKISSASGRFPSFDAQRHPDVRGFIKLKSVHRHQAKFAQFEAFKLLLLATG